jgi:hypothetical protein
MGILENFENAWDIEFQEEPTPPQYESSPMIVTDNMGRPVEDTSLSVKIFSETCCTNCSCKSE